MQNWERTEEGNICIPEKEAEIDQKNTVILANRHQDSPLAIDEWKCGGYIGRFGIHFFSQLLLAILYKGYFVQVSISVVQLDFEGNPFK